MGQAPPYGFLPQADATAGVAAGRHAETVFVHFFVFEDALDVVAGFGKRDLRDPFVQRQAGVGGKPLVDPRGPGVVSGGGVGEVAEFV